MYHINLRTFFDRLTHTRRQERVIFTQEAAHYQEAIDEVNVCHGHTQPGCATLLAVGTKVRLP